MKKIIVFLTLSLMLSTSWAYATSTDSINSIDVSSLTAKQKAELLTKAADMQKAATDPTNVSESVRNEASKWIDLGGNMGKAAVGAAKEIGMAANDFVQTPLGKVTMGVVVYKIIGHDLLKMAVGGFVLLFSYGAALYFVLRKNYDHVEYEVIKVLGIFNRRVVKSFNTDTDGRTSSLIAAGLIVVVGSIVGLSIIF